MRIRKKHASGKEKRLSVFLYLMFTVFFAVMFMVIWKTKGNMQKTMNSLADATVNGTSYSGGNSGKAPTRQGQSDKIIPDKSDWRLLLVNRWNKLPSNYSVDVRRIKGGHAVDERVYPDLQDMMDDARSAGLDPVICSSYRTPQKQQRLFAQQIAKYRGQGYAEEEAYNQAAMWVAIPGTSEHETGLALDIVARSYQLLDKNQENTAEQRWLMENSYKYGFILRYPNDKSDITGIEYEPWHYRYVGKEAAAEIYKKGICLEEYLQGL